MGKSHNKDKALKGRDKVCCPVQGFVLFYRDTQGIARASLALGWLVCGPLALRGTASAG